MDTLQRIKECHLKMNKNPKIVFWGSLFSRLKKQVVTTEDTAATDGESLFINAEYEASLNNDELIGLLAHETYHAANKHPERLKGRDPLTANIAADLIINHDLIAAGLTLPKGGILTASDGLQALGLPADPTFVVKAGMNFEFIYSELEKRLSRQKQQQKQGQGSPQQGDPDPNGNQSADPENSQQGGKDQPEKRLSTGRFTEPPKDQKSTDWSIAVEQALAVAEKAGHVPANVARRFAEQRASVTDWRDVLSEFLEPLHPVDYSWQRPDRNYLQRGLIIPGLMYEGMPGFTVAIDTSGSISERLLGIFQAELRKIQADLNPEFIQVIYCDCQVNRVDRFEDGQDVTLRPCGGGGTAFQPVFDHVAKSGEVPTCLIYFTDLYGDDPKDPGYPVLWITLPTYAKVPFGVQVPIND